MNTNTQSHEKQQQPINPLTPEQRENLLKVLHAKAGEKPLDDKQYDEIRPYHDSRRGGIRYEAFDLVRDDKEVVEAAKGNKAVFAQELQEFRIEAKQNRDLILKALKQLADPEFKQVVQFLDRRQRGLHYELLETFRDDKEVIDAVKALRETWQERSAKGVDKENSMPAQAVEGKSVGTDKPEPPEPPPPGEEATPSNGEVIREYLARSDPGSHVGAGKGAEMEQGD